MSSPKRIVYFLIAVAFAGAFLFWQPLLIFSANVFLRYEIQKNLNCSFSVRSIGFQDGSFHLRGVKLALQESRKNLSVDIEKVLLSPSFSTGALHVGVSILRPHLFIAEGALDDFSWDGWKDFSKKRVQLHLDVSDGELQFHQGSSLRRASFSFHSHKIELHFPEDPLAFIKVVIPEAAVDPFQMEFGKARGEDLLGLAALFTQRPLPSSLSGNFDGLARLELEGESLSHFSFRLSCPDLAFSFADWDGGMKNTELSAEGKFSQSEKGFFTHFLFAKPSDFLFRTSFTDGVLKKEGPWEINGLIGFLSYNQEIGLKGDLKGSFNGKSFQCDAKGFFASTVQDWLDADLSFLDEGSTLSLQFQDLHKEKIILQTQVEKMDASMAAFLQPIFLRKASPFADLRFQEGSCSLGAQFAFGREGLCSFVLQKLDGSAMRWHWPSRKMALLIPRLQGDCAVDFSRREQFSGSLKIWDGEAAFSSADQKVCKIGGVIGKIELAEGNLLPSRVQFSFNAIENELELNGSLIDLTATLRSFGALDDLSLFHPLEASPVQNLPNEEAELLISYQAKEEGFEISGALQILNEEKRLEDWSFGFQFIKNSFFSYPIKGHISGIGAELKRYLPFFPKEIASLSGFADFSLTIKEDQIYLLASLNDVNIATELWHCKVPSLGFHEEQIFCVYDLSVKKAKTAFSIQGAQFYLPAFDLNFHNVQGRFALENDELVLSVDSVESEGLNLGGEIVLDFTQKEAVTLAIVSDFMNGSIEDGRKFFEHFHRSFFTTIPLCGKLQSPPGGFYLSTVFGDKKGIDFGLVAHLESGKMNFSPSAHLQDFRGVLTWDSENESCTLTNASALISLGLDGKVVYPLKFAEFEMQGDDHWIFDLRLEKPEWDILRLKGSFDVQEEENEHVLAEFWFDAKATHFFGSPLKIKRFFIKDFEEILAAELSPVLQLNKLFPELQFLSDMGWLPLRNFSLAPWMMEKMDGTMNFSIAYFPEKESQIKLQGKDLIFFGNNIKNVSLAGMLKQKGIQVQSCLVDDFSGSFLLEAQGEKCKISGLTGSYSDAVTFNLDAQYAGGSKLDIKITQIETNLEKLQKKMSLLPLPLQGNFSGTGFLSLQFQENAWSWEADLDVNPKDIVAGSMKWENKSPLHLYHSSKTGLMLRGLDVDFHQVDAGISFVGCKVGTLLYDGLEGKWVLKDMQGFLPRDFYALLEKTFEHLKWQDAGKMLASLKETYPLGEGIEIKGDGAFSCDFQNVELSLPGLNIPLFGEMQRLEDVYFQYGPKEAGLAFKFLHLDGLYQIAIQAQLGSKPSGKVVFQEDGVVEKEPLTVYWSWRDPLGFKIEQMEGAFCGTYASFQETVPSANEVASSLMGTLKIDFFQAKYLLPKDVFETLSKYNLGDGFELKGKVSFDPVTKKAQFNGIFIGKQCEVLGYEFKTLFAKVAASSEEMQISDFKISDSAGIVKVEKIHLQKEKEGWQLSMPEFLIEEFRPSLLQKINGKAGEIEPLVVRKLVLSDLKGNIQDSNTLTGKGSLHFINSFKREHTIFDFPADVLGRIFGLDLELLIPVRGTIDYEIKDGKFLLTDLRDSYSENKRSKFFLVSSKDSPPYMDFDGNLSIDLRMKQYVLFKFTEQFIISIGGKLSNPTFNLKKKKSFFSL